MTKNVVWCHTVIHDQNKIFNASFEERCTSIFEDLTFSYFSPFSCIMKKRGTGPLAQDLVSSIHPSFERFQKERGLLVGG